MLSINYIRKGQFAELSNHGVSSFIYGPVWIAGLRKSVEIARQLPLNHTLHFFGEHSGDSVYRVIERRADSSSLVCFFTGSIKIDLQVIPKKERQFIESKGKWKLKIEEVFNQFSIEEFNRQFSNDAPDLKVNDSDFGVALKSRIDHELKEGNFGLEALTLSTDRITFWEPFYFTKKIEERRMEAQCSEPPDMFEDGTWILFF